MDLRAVQAPLKERYRSDPDASRITLVARGSESGGPAGCSVDLGRTIQQAEAHTGRIEVVADGDIDLRGTPGIDSELAHA